MLQTIKKLKVVTLTRRATIDSKCGAVNSELNGAIGRDVECPFTGEVSLRVAIRPIWSLETSCGFHEHLVTVDQAGFSIGYQGISIPALADVGSFGIDTLMLASMVGSRALVYLCDKKVH